MPSDKILEGLYKSKLQNSVQLQTVLRVKKGRQPTLRGQWESVFSGRHMDNVPKETPVVSVTKSKTLETEDKVRGDKDDRLLLHPIRRQNRQTARDRNPNMDQAVNRKNWLDMSEIPCRFRFCKNPSRKCWHPPVCLNFRSEKACVRGDKCHFRHVEAEGKPN